MYAVLPADVDDPARVSGGNVYDRRILDALGARGDRAVEIAAAGSWPVPAPADLAALATGLAAVPDGATVLLDGLVACAAPTVVVPAAARLRLVVLVHLPLGDETGAAPELSVGERAVLRAAALVVVTSAWSAARIAELHGVTPRVVCPGADPAPVAAGGDALLCVGSLTPTKGQDVLVAALARLADRAWRCRLVGPLTRAPEHVARVRAAVAEHGLAERVAIVGPAAGAALAAEYAASEALVLPSRRESYGMVLLDALARGIPVVASAVGGVAEAVGVSPAGEVPGLLVPPDDPAELAAALARFLDDGTLRRRLRRAAADRRPTLPTWDDAASTLHATLTGAAA